MTRRHWAGFAALCLLAGSAWLFDQAFTGMWTGLLRMALHDGALALGLWSAGGKVASGHRNLFLARRPNPEWLKIALAGAAIFAIPQVLIAGAGGHVSELTVVLVFMLAPVAVVFAVAQKEAGFGADGNPLPRMMPALAGLGGAGLILPFAWPATSVGQAWLLAIAASALGAGVAAVWLHGLLAEAQLLRATALVCAGSGLVAGTFCWIGWAGWPPVTWQGLGFEALRCAVVELPILLLTVWLLREMEPGRFSARYLLMPLVTIVESFVMLRPPLSWTTAAGIALLAAGGWVLARDDSAPMKAIS
jgi:drug/metabolite transporter (DMT)-like permease